MNRWMAWAIRYLVLDCWLDRSFEEALDWWDELLMLLEIEESRRSMPCVAIKGCGIVAIIGLGNGSKLSPAAVNGWNGLND